MVMKKVGSYNILTTHGNENCPLAAIEQAISGHACQYRSVKYSVRMHLDGGREFNMHSIPEYIAKALQQIDDDTGDLPHLLRAAVQWGMDPFNAVKAVRIKTAHDNASCKLNTGIAHTGGEYYDKPVDVAFCSSEHFYEESQSIATLDDNSDFSITDPSHALYIAGIYRCDIEVNGQKVSDIGVGNVGDCGFGISLNVPDAEKTPLFIASEEEAHFLSHYDHTKREYQYCPERMAVNDRLCADEFVHVAGKNKRKLIEIEINSISHEGVYRADAVTNDERLPMIPSNAFLLSRCLGVDAFVDEELVKHQEQMREER